MQFNFPIILPVFVVAVLLLGALIRLLSKKTGSALAYVRRDSLFSPAERSFLSVLDAAIGNDHRVFGKVRVADVIAPKASENSSQWREAFNRIAAKHFDFVVCKADDLSVVCVVELDDKSHATNRAKKRDTFIDQLCATSGMLLLRVTARRAYNQQELRDEFLRMRSRASPEDAVSQIRP